MQKGLSKTVLHQFIESIVVRSANTDVARLHPGEPQERVNPLPDVARKLRVRQLRLQAAPRSVCTSLKDLCEL